MKFERPLGGYSTRGRVRQSQGGLLEVSEREQGAEGLVTENLQNHRWRFVTQTKAMHATSNHVLLQGYLGSTGANGHRGLPTVAQTVILASYWLCMTQYARGSISPLSIRMLSGARRLKNLYYSGVGPR
jgi:hypothetical protein